jgi:hypothetical protein
VQLFTHFKFPEDGDSLTKAAERRSRELDEANTLGGLQVNPLRSELSIYRLSCFSRASFDRQKLCAGDY